MRRIEQQYPASPPRQYVTPSQNSCEMQRRPYPFVYQVYGTTPEHEISSGFPGGFSPVRTNRPHNNVSPPSSTRTTEDSLYASFSPPRRVAPTSRQQKHRGPTEIGASIFRPKQGSVIVARNNSSHDEGSSITFGSKSTPSPSTKVCNVSSEALIVKQNTAFPSKLHEILSSPEFQDLITWLPHGRAWRVLKPKVFEEKIIPRFFRSSKYASFMRQVNGWGFRRIVTPGPDFNAYWHELFLRGLPDVCTKMKRPQKNDPDMKNEDPPDFYRVSKFSPLPKHGVSPAVAQSSSMSSVSFDPLLASKEHGHQSDRHSRERESRGHTGYSGADSWDQHTDQSPDVAINLCNVYDREDKRNSASQATLVGGTMKLSEADFDYLVRQNRALIKQAHAHQSRDGCRR